MQPKVSKQETYTDLAFINDLKEVSVNRWTNGNGFYYKLTKQGFIKID